MGYSNASRAFEQWSHLGHRDGRLLAYMALCSDDRDEVPVYWGGWAKAAAVLGVDPFEQQDNAKEVFRRAIAALRKAGAIVSSGHAGPNQRAEYALTLDPAMTAEASITQTENGRKVFHWTTAPRPEWGTETVPHEPTEKVPQWGTETVGNGAPKQCPLKKPINTLENRQNTPTQATTSLDPVDNSEEAKNLEYQSALKHLMRNPDTQQAFMDQATAKLPADAGSHAKVTLAAALAGWKAQAA